MNKFCLDEGNIDFLKQAFNVLSEPNRIRIICMLGKSEEDLCVCEIVDDLGLKQNLVSHHLGVLKKINLVSSEKKGKYIYYSLNKEVYDKLKKIIGEVFNF
ncbi:MAG: metalloregulator ArsR/SmtB family transcription factor [Candidatus Gracilibacteria bacterium]|nr:metalloregulator ArsR/SmtB family transcription factor [Candidatus Gracilibacteria bacterium]